MTLFGFLHAYAGEVFAVSLFVSIIVVLLK